MSMFQEKIEKKEKIILLLVFILAFTVRFIYILGISRLPLFDFPFADALYNLDWAKQIASGDLWAKAPFFRAPLYPFFLSLLIKVFGEDLYFLRIVQILIASLSCVLICLLARKLFNFKVALLSAIFACFYAPFIFYEAEFQDTFLIIFLDILLVYLLFLAQKKPSLFRFFLSGIILGLSAITRPNILLFAVFIPFWIFFYFRKKISLRSALNFAAFFLLGICLIVLPVILVNYFAGKDFVIISWQGGINFYLGNNPYASGYKVVASGIRTTWEGIYYDGINLANQMSGRELTFSGSQNFWFKQGLNFILKQPFPALKLYLKKIALFLSGYEISENPNIYFFWAQPQNILKPILWKNIFYFPTGILLPLGWLGLFLSFRSWRKFSIVPGFIFVYMLSVIIFFVNTRFRLPIIPLLLIFSAYAIFRIIEEKKVKTKIMIISAGILLILLGNIDLTRQMDPVYKAQLHYLLGNAYLKQRSYQNAEDEFTKSILISKEQARGFTGLGVIRSIQGNNEEAESLLKKALEIDSTEVYAYRYLGDLFIRKNEFSTALQMYKIALSLNPEYGEAYFGAGYVYANLGDLKKAVEMWEKSLVYSPDLPGTRENLERARRMLKESSE
ncbi:MAG: glycosyltransferase family 39 protein [candidate division Zixibacteria bacterium]|nr:glycosyltransferase family 39 protein [candidate division Zixibacteria bacterium]